MKGRFHELVLIVGVLTLVSGASAAADPTAGARKIPPPPAGKAEVVFFRPLAWMGVILSFPIRDGGDEVATLSNNHYAIYVADPGDHTFTTKSEATDTLHMELDAGEIYYVKDTIGAGLLLDRPHLTPSDEATFEKLKSLIPAD